MWSGGRGRGRRTTGDGDSTTEGIGVAGGGCAEIVAVGDEAGVVDAVTGGSGNGNVFGIGTVTIVVGCINAGSSAIYCPISSLPTSTGSIGDVDGGGD